MLKDVLSAAALFLASLFGLSPEVPTFQPPLDPVPLLDEIREPLTVELSPVRVTGGSPVPTPIAPSPAPPVRPDAITRADLDAAIATLRSDVLTITASGQRGITDAQTYVDARHYRRQVDRIYDSVGRGLDGVHTALSDRIASLAADDIPDLSAVYLSLAGGTLDGAVAGTDLTLTGTLTANALSVSALSLGSALEVSYLVATSTDHDSTFTRLSVVHATSTSLAISGISNALLKTDPLGRVSAAVAGTDFALPAEIAAAFPFTPGAFGATSVNATSTALQLLGGLYASSTILFGNAGVSPFVFDGATGRVGIGTTSPWRALSVAGSTVFEQGGTGNFLVGSAGSAGSVAFARNSDGGATGFVGYLAGAESSNVSLQANGGGGLLTFYTAGSERLRIDASGRVGIGTTSPDHSLTVAGSGDLARLGNVSGGTYNGNLVLATTDQFPSVKFRSGTTNRAQIVADVNTGRINLDAPGDFLVRDTINGGTTLLAVQASTGRIGIGAGNGPTARLDVADTDTNTTIKIRNNDSTTGRFPQISVENFMGAAGTGQPALSVYNRRGTVSAPLPLLSGDIMGSVVAPSFDGSGSSWTGSMRFLAREDHSASAGGTAIIFNTTPNGSRSGSERLRIDHNGNVGIGTTGPKERLQIAGSIAVSGGSGIRGNLYYDGDWKYLGTGYGQAITFNSTDGRMYFANTSSSGTADASATVSSRMVLDANGRLGVGSTTPWRTLSVTGTVGMVGLGSAGGTATLCLTDAFEVVTSNGECVASSRDLKEDIEPLTATAGDILAALQPASFRYTGDDRPTLGFIAEDLAAVDDRLIGYFDAAGKPRTINTTAILAATVSALQTIRKTVQNLIVRVSGVEERMDAHERRLQDIESRLAIPPTPQPPSGEEPPQAGANDTTAEAIPDDPVAEQPTADDAAAPAENPPDHEAE